MASVVPFPGGASPSASVRQFMELAVNDAMPPSACPV
ncbi:Uncharacterised protein [Mycobacteroides abscessus subsp. abscessus]|nr:Uncharacterised protein [Mycobacteroides abscessus subsp. abscessus]